MPRISQLRPETSRTAPCAFPALLLALTLSICPLAAVGLPAQPQASSTPAPIDQKSRLYGDEAHPASTNGWVETKLYFGLGPAASQHKGISEEAWRHFLDKEVTPRFPAGLSVLDVYGQWTGKGQSAPERIRSKLLLICYPRSAENDSRIEAIRAAWKKKTGDQSVMKVTLPADISF